jgi:hypothetical protein
MGRDVQAGGKKRGSAPPIYQWLIIFFFVGKRKRNVKGGTGRIIGNMEVAYEIHLWFIVLMAGAVALAVLVAVVTAILAARQRNR